MFFLPVVGNAMKFFSPLGVYMTDDGGEWLIRDYAGQSGRFCVIGPYTVDIMGSFKTMKEARKFIEWRAGTGSWQVSGSRRQP